MRPLYFRLHLLTRWENRQMQISSHIAEDFPDLVSSRNLQIISGLLYVPLSTGGQDFIAFLRKGQSREVHWAGKPYKDGKEKGANLEPRQSFKVWSETIAGKSKNWTDEQLETAGVLALVYGKFIEVWRQKESALKANQMTSLLLSNATHEGRSRDLYLQAAVAEPLMHLQSAHHSIRSSSKFIELQIPNSHADYAYGS
jgi:light-regulated signal transduction histidine kinase (bacteriophytochrome)